MRTLATCAGTAVLLSTLAACEEEEPIDPGSFSALNRSSVTVSVVLGRHQRETLSYPSTLVVENGELVAADTIRVPAPTAHLAWYRGGASDYSYFLETGDAHMTVSGGSGDRHSSPEVESGPCSSE